MIWNFQWWFDWLSFFVGVSWDTDKEVVVQVGPVVLTWWQSTKRGPWHETYKC